MAWKREKSLPDFEMPEIVVSQSKEERFGDYSTNIAMVLGKILKKNPMEVAREIKSAIADKMFDPATPSFNLDGANSISKVEPLKGEVGPRDAFEKIEAVAPGYINFYLSQKYLQRLIAEINEKKEKFGNLKKKKGKTMVEYSQPNTHKEFHIGHLRNVFIGSALVEVLKKSGRGVVAANYIGDTGSHIAKCLWGIQKFHAGENPDSIQDKSEFLGKAYAEAVRAIEENPENEKEFKKLQNKFDQGDSALVELWQKTRQWSLDEFQSIYKMLGAEFDAYFYESEEEIAGKKLLPELLKKKIIKESEGAIIANLELYNLGVLVLVRKDGSALYGLKDIPLAIKKFDDFKIDNSIYVVDIRQSLYFRQLFKILELYGFRKKMAHIGYEFVALKGGEGMSSRKGNIILAKDLIDNVRERVKSKFPESPDPLQIALGAIKFSMLKYSAASKIEFDIEGSVKLEGATGPYVQYAHARISSILRKSENVLVGGSAPEALRFNLDGANSISKVEPLKHRSNLEMLTHEKELSLIKELNKFPELVEEIAQNYEIHKLPHYAVKLADKFHSFYNECRVIDAENPELASARLNLVNAVRIVLAEALRLIGAQAPEKM